MGGWGGDCMGMTGDLQVLQVLEVLQLIEP
jgi:hypothetical protein